MTLAEPGRRTSRFGVAVPLDDRPMNEHRDALRRLHRAGYGSVWAGEAAGLDAVSPLAAAAAWVPGVSIGTSIVPTSTRGPAVLATTAAGLAELAPGRVSFGIGSSSPIVVTDWNDRPFDHPYQRTRDTLRFLRAALAGERVTCDHETLSVRGFRLERPPSRPPALLLAALRPDMLRLAATEGDGAITTWLPSSRVSKVVEEYRRHGGRRLVAWVTVCPAEQATEIRDAFRRNIAAYLTVPSYAAFFEWLGLGAVIAPMREAWARGDRHAALAAVPDHLVDELLIHGSPKTCRRRLGDLLAAGVDELAIGVLPGFGDPVDSLLAIAGPS